MLGLQVYSVPAKTFTNAVPPEDTGESYQRLLRIIEVAHRLLTSTQQPVSEETYHVEHVHVLQNHTH